MRNPFRREVGVETEMEEQAARVFAPLAAEQPSEGARRVVLQALASAAETTPATPGFALRRRLALAGAVVAPLMAVSAVGALTGQNQLSAPIDAVSNVAGALGVGGNSEGHRQDSDHRNGGKAGTNGQPGSQPGQSANAPAFSVNPAGNGPQGTAGAENADEAHNNERGCDDTLFDQGDPPLATPGGPQGCTVGNSGAHRKNGASDDTQSNGNGTQGQGGSAAADAAHTNGKGCDDVNPAVIGDGPTPGGPQDCKVGNSEDHRQNGDDHGQGNSSGQGNGNSPQPSSTPKPGNSSGQGNAGGNQGSNGQGSGKPKDK